MTPKRQRDYAAEYARRSKAGIAAGREATAKEAGFKSYGQYRSSADKISREFQELGQREQWTGPPPARGSTIWNDLMRADAILKRYSSSQRREAAQNKESLLGRTKEGKAVRERLRTALGWKSEAGWGAVYFPVMRTLY